MLLSARSRIRSTGASGAAPRRGISLFSTAAPRMCSPDALAPARRPPTSQCPFPSSPAVRTSSETSQSACDSVFVLRIRDGQGACGGRGIGNGASRASTARSRHGRSSSPSCSCRTISAMPGTNSGAARLSELTMAGPTIRAACFPPRRWRRRVAVLICPN